MVYSGTSWCMQFRNRSPKCIGFCSFLFWIPQLLVNVCIPVKVIGSKSVSVETSYGYCSLVMQTDWSAYYMQSYFLLLMLCLAFMKWTSRYMVVVLHRPKQQVKNIHSNRPTPRPFHEARSTHTILIWWDYLSTFIVSLPLWLYVLL